VSANAVRAVVADAERADGLSGGVFDALPVAVVVPNGLDLRLAIISCRFRGHPKHVWLLLCVAVPEKVERPHVKLGLYPF